MTENVDRSTTEEPTVEAVAGGELEKSKRKYERNPDRVMCKARSKRTGDPCNNPPVAGATVCRMHGGSAPQVRAAARVRLEMAADRMAKELLGIAVDDDAPAAVKLAAIKDALDRAGLSAKSAVTVEVGPTKEYEEILTTALTGGSRAESRAARGQEDKAAPDWLADELETARAVDADDVIDAEVVNVDDAAPAICCPDLRAHATRYRPHVDGGRIGSLASHITARAGGPPPQARIGHQMPLSVAISDRRGQVAVRAGVARHVNHTAHRIPPTCDNAAYSNECAK